MSKQLNILTSALHHRLPKASQLDEEQQIESPQSGVVSPELGDDQSYSMDTPENNNRGQRSNSVAINSSESSESEDLSDSGDTDDSAREHTDRTWKRRSRPSNARSSTNPFLSRMRTRSFIDYTKYSKRTVGQFFRDSIAAVDSKIGKYVRFFLPNFICIHYFYIIMSGLICSFFLYITGNIEYIDCFFLSYAAVSQAGLNTVDLNDIHLFQQLILFFICIITTPIFIHTAVVFVRLYWFERTFDSIKSKSKLNFKMRRDLTLSARSMTQNASDNHANNSESLFSKTAHKFSSLKPWKVQKKNSQKQNSDSSIFIELRNMIPTRSNTLQTSTTGNKAHKSHKRGYSFNFKNGPKRTLTKHSNIENISSKKFDPTDMYRSIAMMREKKENHPTTQKLDNSVNGSSASTTLHNSSVNVSSSNLNSLYPISSADSNNNATVIPNNFDYEENEGPALVIEGPAERIEAMNEEKRRLKRLQQKRKKMKKGMQKRMKRMSKNSKRMSSDDDEISASNINSGTNNKIGKHSIGSGSFGSFLLQKRSPLFSPKKKNVINSKDEEDDFAIDDNNDYENDGEVEDDEVEDDGEEQDEPEDEDMEDDEEIDDTKVENISPERDDSDDEETIDPKLIVRGIRSQNTIPQEKKLSNSSKVNFNDEKLASESFNDENSIKSNMDDTAREAPNGDNDNDNIQPGRGGLSFNISEKPNRQRQFSYSSYNQSPNKKKLLADIKKRPSFYLQSMSKKLQKYPSMMFEDLNNNNNSSGHHHGKRNFKDLGLQRSMSTGYLSFNPTFGRNSTFVPLNNQQKEELGGVEYRSLKLLATIIVVFYFGGQLISFAGLAILINTKSYYRNIVDDFGLNATWWASFTAASAFNNLGFSLTPNSLSSFITNDFTLLWCSFFTTIGNVGFPIALRAIIWVLFNFCARDLSLFKESLGFLLDHPRRCFTMLFPTIPTLWLFAILVIFNVFDLALFCILDINNEDFKSIGVGNRVLGGFFQSISTRTSGLSCMSLADLHPAVQVSYMTMMYVSAFPVAISIRRTNVYEEQSLGIYQQPELEESASEDESISDGRGIDAQNSKKENLDKNSRNRRFVETHLRKQLSFDLWYIFIGVFIIAIAEGGKIKDDAQPDFNLFSVIFEVISAYCCVGLSLGYPSYNTSFAGQFNVVSKLTLVAMFIRGRHRGLPYVIDRAIMLPSANMERRDELQANQFRRNRQHRNSTSSTQDDNTGDSSYEDNNRNNEASDDFVSPDSDITPGENKSSPYFNNPPSRVYSNHRRIDEVMDPKNTNRISKNSQITINSPNLDELNQKNLDDIMNEDLSDSNNETKETDTEDRSSLKNHENSNSNENTEAVRVKPLRRNTITFDSDTSFRTNANHYQQFS